MNVKNAYTIQKAWDAGVPIVAIRDDGVGGMNAILTTVHYFLDSSRYPDGIPPKPSAGELEGQLVYEIVAPGYSMKNRSERVVVAIRNPIRIREIPVSALAHGFSDAEFPNDKE
jgi:hypothetical protein